MKKKANRNAITIALVLAAVVSSAIGVAKAVACPPHPYPCGNEAPAGLEGPFGLAEVSYVRVPVPADYDNAEAGTIELEGWIGMPTVPAGVEVPVALHVSPYLGACYGEAHCTSDPGDPAYWTSQPSGIPPDAANNGEAWTWGVPPIELVRHGFAAAFFSVRGTAGSGGCFEMGGANEQRDHERLVDWVATRTWSNGRVAMGGLSSPAWTALLAATSGHPALKTIVVGGIVSDLYTLWHSPQGALDLAGLVAPPWYASTVSAAPPVAGGPAAASRYGAVVPERPCKDLVRAVTHVAEGSTGSRPEDFYRSRRPIDGFDRITASVLLTQGFEDYGHWYQSSAAWNALDNAPRRQVVGWWGHTFPIPEAATLDPSWTHSGWDELLFSWLDYWLKGIGPTPEHLGSVDYQDSTGGWHNSGAWPPSEAREEVLHLAGEALAPEADESSRTFRALPLPLNDFWGAEAGSYSPFNAWPSLCGGEEASALGVGVGYEAAPLDHSVTIAGNGFAYLRISSDQPGGLVGVQVLEIAGDFECGAGFDPSKVGVVTYGVADLRFHRGNMTAEDFPVGVPIHIRLDFWDSARRLEPGSRLAVVVAGSPEWSYYPTAGQPYNPEITVHGDSHIVLPVVEGTLGGSAPTIVYPPRPFVP